MILAKSIPMQPAVMHKIIPPAINTELLITPIGGHITPITSIVNPKTKLT